MLIKLGYVELSTSITKDAFPAKTWENQRKKVFKKSIYTSNIKVVGPISYLS